jgi:peptide/nickel transport system substrate-binding protein
MVVLLIPEEPSTLNLYMAEAGIVRQVADAIIEGLVSFDPDGQYYPVLTAELPTRQNGGVSENFRVITWKLRPGLRWSDGQPITSGDIKFTWEAVANPESGALQTGGFNLIDKIETPDDLTAIVYYKEFYVGYLGQFRFGVIPRHAAGKSNEMSDWDWNRKPVASGPFMVDEWKPGESITVKPNPYYRESGKPYLDQLVFRVIPAYETQLAMMKTGEAHVQVWPSDSKKDYDEMMGGTAIQAIVPGLWNMEFNFNLSKPYDGDPGPQPPHPILGDLRVRQAIAYGINYDYIIKDVMNGEVYPSYSPFEYGWYKCEMQRPYPTDPDKAKSLLDEAGWKDEDGDGIRECHGCLYAETGTLLRLQLLGYYAPDLQRTEEAIVEEMKAIGIEMYIQNEDFSVIFGNWEDRAPRKTGDFDVQIYDGLVEAEPQDTVISQWRSDQIPSAENPEGRNYFRWVNAKADEAINRAGVTPDLNERKQAYCDLAQEMSKDLKCNLTS